MFKLGGLLFYKSLSDDIILLNLFGSNNYYKVNDNYINDDKLEKKIGKKSLINLIIFYLLAIIYPFFNLFKRKEVNINNQSHKIKIVEH